MFPSIRGWTYFQRLVTCFLKISDHFTQIWMNLISIWKSKPVLVFKWLLCWLVLHNFDHDQVSMFNKMSFSRLPGQRRSGRGPWAEHLREPFSHLLPHLPPFFFLQPCFTLPPPHRTHTHTCSTSIFFPNSFYFSHKWAASRWFHNHRVCFVPGPISE